MNPNDEIRRQILRYFYDRNRNATSRTGKKGSAVKISDVKRELKAEYGLSQQQVMGNLTYLIDNDWIKVFEIEKTVTVRGGTVPSTTSFYEITAKGIDKIEGGSQFEPRDRYSGISITATGSNIITLGDGNVVNATYAALHEALGELKEVVSESSRLDETEKLNLAVDIESVRDQLARPNPRTDVIRQIWTGIEGLGTLEGAAAAFGRVRDLIIPLLG
jgi:hypothetical protein